ncbi:MAG: SGNH/GDSL hydrolase family protein [Cyclobacteriaceae bacterium]
MIFKRHILILLTLATLLAACSAKQELFVDYAHSAIVYSGRVDSTGQTKVNLSWSGTSIKFNFEGESIAALLEDDNGDNYYNVFIDENSPFILRPDTTKRYYQLASGLSEGKHTIEIFKRTEFNRGKTSFYGFRIGGKPKVLPKPSSAKLKFEFYGNSISAGYAVEDLSGRDSPDSTYTNNYLSYAAITARNFEADYQCICRSGIGIMISWFPQIMPEIYDRLDPTDTGSTWDFDSYKPDIVVINLMQNDSWLVNRPEHPEFKRRFGDSPPEEDFIIKSYQQFVAKIRGHYPEANIICALGTMDATMEGSKWIDYVQSAADNLNDPKVFTHFMPFKGTPGHPSIEEQEEMANSLTQFIDENILK